MRATCRAIAQLSPRTHKASVALELGRIAGEKTPQQLQPGEIAQLLATWKGRLSVPTQRTYSVTLRNALRWLNRPDLAELVPKIRNPRSHPPVAAPGEIDRLMAVAPAWLRAYILLASHAALRRSDALTVSEAKIHAGTIHLVQFKTGQPVAIPTSPQIEALVATLPPGDPQTPIVERIAGRKVSFAMLEHHWHQAKKKAGVNPKLRPHSMRHTAATKLYDATLDVRLVQQFLGHDALATTAEYLEHHDPARMKAILEKMWKPKGPVQ